MSPQASRELRIGSRQSPLQDLLLAPLCRQIQGKKGHHADDPGAKPAEGDARQLPLGDRGADQHTAQNQNRAAADHLPCGLRTDRRAVDGVVPHAPSPFRLPDVEKTSRWTTVDCIQARVKCREIARSEISIVHPVFIRQSLRSQSA